MRHSASADGLTAMAVAGTNVVMLGWDMTAAQIQAQNVLGFSVGRQRDADLEVRWMKGMKTFASVEPDPAAGVPVSSFDHPFQTFQWADYSVSPGHTYTYTIVACRGPADALQAGALVTLTVTTEPVSNTVLSPRLGADTYCSRLGGHRPVARQRSRLQRIGRSPARDDGGVCRCDPARPRSRPTGRSGTDDRTSWFWHAGRRGIGFDRGKRLHAFHPAHLEVGVALAAYRKTQDVLCLNLGGRHVPAKHHDVGAGHRHRRQSVR